MIADPLVVLKTKPLTNQNLPRFILVTFFS